jgi:hypothetical protein
MQKIYLKILIGIIVLMWSIYIIQSYFVSSKEPFISSLYRPYIRKANEKYESFINNYGPNVIVTKLKKWNIY